MVLEAMPAPYQLPEALSRGAVLSMGSGVLIVGGLTRRDMTADAVTWLDPVNGATRVMGHLTDPVRDAAGAVLGGRAYVFGGRGPGSTDTVQAVDPGMGTAGVGRLPGGRWGAAAVTAGAVAYLIGGYDGKALDPAVLATADGRHFRVAARLRVPVRYAATAAGPDGIWVFGGQTASGATDVIQRIDPVDGKTVVAGRLPLPLQGAAAVSLDGRIYVAGGAAAGAVSGVV
jgi:N-acetylneuraminic acid mutarotase